MQTWELCPTCAKVHMELVKGHQGELRAFVGGRSQKEQPQQYSEQQQHLREMQRYMEDMRRKQPTSIIPIDKEWGTW